MSNRKERRKHLQPVYKITTQSIDRAAKLYATIVGHGVELSVIPPQPRENERKKLKLAKRALYRELLKPQPTKEPNE
jgi:hypothetical protein